MTEAEHSSAAALQEPFLAASLILFDLQHPSELKLLLGRRHDGHVFLPGKFVFPGGRSEAEDALMSAAGALTASDFARLRNPAAGKPILAPHALALTAIRELFEETGSLLGDRSLLPVEAPAGTSWTQFAKSGVIPNLGKLHYVARALTPPGNRRRFDTHFFAADIRDVAETIVGHVHASAELVELRWATIEEIASLNTLPITRFIATELAERLSQGLRQGHPVPYFYTQAECWIRAEL